MRPRLVSRAVLAVATICLSGTTRALTEPELLAVNAPYVVPSPSESPVDHVPDAVYVETVPPDVGDILPGPTSSAVGPAIDNRLLLVSTLDGQLSAIDTAAGGTLLWSVQASETGLLKSTLTQNLQLSQQGQWVRLIPSLDGGLFTYDGEQVEALPITAETLLQSSFRFADDTVLMGGNEVITLGIDLRTGHIRYRCTGAGCERFRRPVKDGGDNNAEEDDGSDVLVLRQHTRTVRAIEPRSGQERWNFSVSRHELAMSLGSRASTPASPPPVDSVLTAGLSEGRLSGVERGRRWQHQFDGPLVHVWRLASSRLQEVDLLAPMATGDDSDAVVKPLLYLGVHQQQLYIQQSHSTPLGILGDTRLAVAPGARGPPLVKWRPYMVSASSRTPVIHGTTSREQNPLMLSDHAGTALAVRPEEYPYEGGYYLYTSDCVLPTESHGPFPNPQLPVSERIPSLEDDSVVHVVITSLSYWWPQILLMSASIAIILNLLVTEHYRLYYKAKAIRAVKNVLRLHAPRLIVREVPVPVREEVIREVVKEVVRDPPPPPTPPPPPPPKSRFLEDFEPMQCLGKGGFGVVFEARNKLDGQSYAVKRTRLPNKERERRKVLREVACLAKLDHRNIVRYSHCWTEKLSPTCLSEQDKLLDSSEWVSSRTPLNSLDSGGVVSAPPSPEDEQPDSMLRITRFVSALPGGEGGEDWRLRTIGGGFLPALEEPDSKSFPHSSIGDESIIFTRTDSVETSGTFSVLDSKELATQQSRSSSDPRLRRIRRSVADANEISASQIDEASESNALLPTAANTSAADDDDSVVFAAESNAPIIDYTLPDSDASSGSSNSTSAGPVVAFQTKQEGSEIWDSEDDHPGIEPIYLFIQMQLCRKETLKDWLSANNSSRSVPQVLAIFRQILNGVEYVHSQRLMHRDLKPSNIFFSIDGIVKIGDFGLATALGSEPTMHTPACAHNCTDSRHTNHVGTRLYMSPEQVLGQPYNDKVDIYSLGIILFELLVPFSTQMERQRVLAMVRRLVFPDEFPIQHPEEHTLLADMLCHAPATRPPIGEIRRSVSRCRVQSRGGALHEDDLDGRSRNKTPSGSTSDSRRDILDTTVSSGAAGSDLCLSDETSNSDEDSDPWISSGLNSTVPTSIDRASTNADIFAPDSSELIFTGIDSPVSNSSPSSAVVDPQTSIADAVSPGLVDHEVAMKEAALTVVYGHEDASAMSPESSTEAKRSPSYRMYLAGLDASERDSD